MDDMIRRRIESKTARAAWQTAAHVKKPPSSGNSGGGGEGGGGGPTP